MHYIQQQARTEERQAVYLSEIKNIIVINVFIIVNNTQKNVTGYGPSACSIKSKKNMMV
jgi:hypothetical protein